MFAVPILLLALAQQPTTCATLEVCRAEALIAHARKDFEAFHDLAWAAYRKGKNNDPELMLLVARAQALSGRPGDALVMLERIAALGAPTDAETSEDFAKVRALPRWKEVQPTLAAPSAKDPAPPAKNPAPPAKPPAPSAKNPAPPAKNPAPPAKAPAPSAKTPLTFTTVLTPSALVYDAVSKRFIIADRQARRIAVIDETSGQVSILVGEQGGLGEVGGVAIDPVQGDLWVVSSNGGGATLHKLQLISGRTLSSVALKGPERPVVAMTFVRGVGLVVADEAGIIWRVRSSGAADRLGALEYVPHALAADGTGRLWVSGGAPRLARFTVAGSSIRKTGVVEVEDSLTMDSAFTVTGDRLLVVVRAGGEYELRSVRLR